MKSPYVQKLTWHKRTIPSQFERKVVVQLDTDKQGNLQKKNTVAMKSVYDGLRGLKCSDFSLQNLALSGAISSLKPVAAMSRDRLTNADALVSQSNEIGYQAEKMQYEAQQKAAEPAPQADPAPAPEPAPAQ